MAVISLTIPDAHLPRVVAALCDRGLGIPPIPVAPTGPHAKAVVAEWVIGVVKAYETRLAEDALPEPNTDGIVT